MTSFYKCKDITFSDSAVFAGPWDFINVYTFFLGEVSNRWSRQGFSATITKWLFTWGGSGNFISHLVLYGYFGIFCRCGLGYCWGALGIRYRSIDLRGRFLSAAVFFDGEDYVANGNDLVVTEVNSCHFTSSSWWNFGDKFVGEYLAEVLVLFDLVANLDIPRFDSCFLGALT